MIIIQASSDVYKFIQNLFLENFGPYFEILNIRKFKKTPHLYKIEYFNEKLNLLNFCIYDSNLECFF